MKDTPIRNFYRLVTDVVYLSFLTFFTIILGLFITTGAALTASFNVMFKLMDQERATYIFKEYKVSFMKNFVISTVLWLGLVAMGLGLFFIYNYANNTDNTLLLVFVYVSGFEVITFTSYVFPILSTFESGSIAQLCKNTVLMMHGHLGVTIRILGTVVFILFLIFRVHSIFIFIGFIIYLYFNSVFLHKLFTRYKERVVTDEIS